MRLLTKVHDLGADLSMGGPMTGSPIGNAYVVHPRDRLRDEIRDFALGLAADPEHELVVVDLPADSSIPVWESAASLLPGRRRGMRLVIGGRSRETLALASQWLSDRLNRMIVAPDGAVLPGVGGSVFVDAGWLRFRPGRTPEHSGKRFPRPVWEKASARVESVPTTASSLTEPLPCGVWLRPRGPESAVQPYRQWLVETLPCQPDVYTVVLGCPGGPSVTLDDIKQFWTRLPEELRSKLRLVKFGPIAPSSNRIAYGQLIADSVGAQIICYTGVPVGSRHQPDVRLLRKDGTLGWKTSLQAMRYTPSIPGEVPLPPTPATYHQPLSGLQELAPAVYTYAEDSVLEVVQSGLWLRPPTVVPRAVAVRALQPDGARHLVLVGDGNTQAPPRLQHLATTLLDHLDPATRALTTLTPAESATPDRIELTGPAPATLTPAEPATLDRAEPTDPAQATLTPAESATPDRIELTGPAPAAFTTSPSAGLTTPPPGAFTTPAPTAFSTPPSAGLTTPPPGALTPPPSAGVSTPPSAAFTTPAPAAFSTPPPGALTTSSPGTPGPGVGPDQVVMAPATDPSLALDAVPLRLESAPPEVPSVLTPSAPAPAGTAPAATPPAVTTPADAATVVPAPADAATVGPAGPGLATVVPARAAAGLQPTPEVAAAALVPKRGLDEERAWLRRTLAREYAAVANSVTRVLSEHPGFQGALERSSGGVLTDAVAIRLYLSGEGDHLDQLLRSATVGPHVPFARCVVSGLSRLPSHRGAAVYSTSVAPEEWQLYRSRKLFTEWGFVNALSAPCATQQHEHDVDVAVWSMTARRMKLLELDEHPITDRVLFVPGTSFKVLDLTEPADGQRGQILLRELAAGEIDASGRVDSNRASLDDLALKSLRRCLETWAGAKGEHRVPPTAASRFGLLPGLVRATPASQKEN
ncbi:hypothetical protein ACIA49_36460 [Kribbella sp. NPDC051587]|uniref:hypothetical protein n=1 Tax=Kribbella sp. NPDC051587 TaxID=3364119 RepID=UPI0037B19791